MACFLVLLASAIGLHGVRSKVRVRLPEINMLLLMTWGGALALIVDHVWNGELFLVSPNLLWDLLLGCAMTLALVAIWSLYVLATRVSSSKNPIRTKMV